jgi:hypothetical protein
MIDIEKYRRLFKDYFNTKNVYFKEIINDDIYFYVHVITPFIAHNKYFNSKKLGEIYLVSLNVKDYDIINKFIIDDSY